MTCIEYFPFFISLTRRITLKKLFCICRFRFAQNFPETFCPVCGFELDKEDTSCRNCGQSLQRKLESELIVTESSLQKLLTNLKFYNEIFTIIFGSFFCGLGVAGLLFLSQFPRWGLGPLQGIIYAANLFWILILIGIVSVIYGILKLRKHKIQKE